jgi:hypothetical protein
MKCAFCNGEAVDHGGEHLWDNWLNKELPKKTRFNAKKRLSMDSAPIEFEPSASIKKARTKPRIILGTARYTV